MKTKLATIVLLLSVVTVMFTSCEEEDPVQAQVALSGEWKMSSFCTGEVDRNPATMDIYPGSGSNEVLLTDIINAMIVYFTKTGETPVVEYSINPSPAVLPVMVDGDNITVNFEWTDSSFDPDNDEPEEDRRYTVTGTGKVSDDHGRITLNLTVTFPDYDPLIEDDGTGAARPKPLSNNCEYTLVKIRHDD